MPSESCTWHFACNFFSMYCTYPQVWSLLIIHSVNTECKNCHQQGSKNYTTFCPDAFRAKGDSMCHVYPVEDCVKGLQDNLFKLPCTQMTPSYTSLLGSNFRPQPFYKSVECWNFSYLLVFKSCYEGEMQRNKWRLKGSFVKIQDLRFKLVL